MGVRGLTTFIDNNAGYLEKYELHDTTVFIDGNSLKCQLFCRFSIRECCAFGGDYDQFAHHAKEFFQMLSKCNVRCVVVFDGGMEEKKVKTILKRLDDKIAEIEHMTPASSSSTAVFPPLLTPVFREVLQEAGVHMVQCDFEADQEISALGLKYNFPVLSNDSDFFISGVQYIPIPTIEYKLCCNKSNQFFIPCKIFRIQNLLNQHPGLNTSLLPLLSALSGNDYVEMTLFRQFYAQILDIGDRFPAAARVERVINWLSSVGRLDSALHKVLNTVEKKNQRLVLAKIEETIKSYNCKKLTVEGYLPSMSTSSSNPELPNERTNQMPGNAGNTSEVKSTAGVKFPNWLLERSRLGFINTTIVDILTLQTCIPPPQVEDRSLNSCDEVAIPLIQALIRIIHGDSKVKVNYWARNKDNAIINHLLEPLNIDLPNLKNIHAQSCDSKRKTLLRLLNVPAEFPIDIFPRDWQLYLFTIFYWIKNTVKPLITDAHVKSLIISMIALNIIDSKLGFIREMSKFLKSFGAKLSKPIISPTKPDCEFKDLLANVDEYDCIVCFDSLLKFHKLDENLKSDSRLFSYSIIHAFAQFQSCLRYVLMINSILDLPFEQCYVHKLYSGTFIYNVYNTLHSCGDEQRVNKLLGRSPRLLEVFQRLVFVMCRPSADSSAAAPAKRCKASAEIKLKKKN